MSAEGVGWLCEHLPVLRDLAAVHQRSTELDALTSAFTTKGDVPDDELLELARKLGQDPGSNTRGADFSWLWRLPDILGGPAARVRYVCPESRCPRAVKREPSGPLPWCPLLERHLLPRSVRHG